MTTATVVGFGTRAPSKVLDLLSRVVDDSNGIHEIRIRRSPRIPERLLEAPYRTFLKNPKPENASATATTPPPNNTNLLVYCIPTSVTEYIGSRSESEFIRSKILDNNSSIETTVVVSYDVATGSFMGGTTEEILSCLIPSIDDNKTKSAALAGATLQALTKLDNETVMDAVGPSRRNDVVIVVGSGGREHALAVALAQSPLVGEVLVCPGNGGTASESNPKIKNRGTNQNNDTVIALVKETNAKMVVVGPEAPLVAGLVDELKAELPEVLCFGPSKAAAELEASKAFTKDFLQEHNIPTAKYRNFTNVDEAIEYVESLDIDNGKDRQVVKASGLAAGKGVLLPTTKAETIAAVKEIMSDKAFGNAGDTCVIESFLVGPEASCFALCDGKTAKLMPAAQDHKRALDNDEGLNTGGMGAYAPAPCVTSDLQKQIEQMCIKTVEKMAERGTPYIGLLYAGMILTPDGPYILEFNCRFGDPETQVVLPLLETDLYEILTACCSGKLDDVDVRFKEGLSAATVVCAAKGYPEKYPKGMEITGLGDTNRMDDVKVYHAGTKIDNKGTTRCSGGRVLAVTGIGNTLKSALQSSYDAVRKLNFVGENGESLMHFRTDIGKKAIQKKLRIGVLGSTRGTALIPVMESCASGGIHAEIVAVVSNKSAAPILEKGRSLGVTVLSKFISAKGLTRSQYDSECTAALVGAGAEYILLIGYMRILSPQFCDFWAGRCVNAHPSLLPLHAGGMDLQVHQAVIDAGEKESGCTIHEVTEQVDGGPILIQKRVQVEETETAESLKSKVQPLEGPAFVEAISAYCKGKVITYADAGVDIDAGNKLVDLIKPFCKATRRAGCDADLGGFGGLFDLASAGFESKDTILIGATDGVGTKLRIAQATKKHSGVGIDLVAMCVNDLIVAGGEPLFFLDYFATGHLEVVEAASVVQGIAEGCKLAGCGLIGGETAEMPSMYAPGDYDLAGFCVGAVHRDRILPSGVAAGDVLLGLASSGIHSNGFSLVRKLVEKEGLSYESPCPWDASVGTIGDSLLTPTRIYVKACLPLLSKQGMVKGMAHITGGGLLENLPRSLPPSIGAEITNHPPLPAVFKWMKDASGLDDNEMLKTFNCGIGLILIVDESLASEAKQLLLDAGEMEVFELGKLISGGGVKMSHQLS